MRKTLAIICAVFLCFSFVACGNNSDGKPNVVGGSNEPSDIVSDDNTVSVKTDATQPEQSLPPEEQTEPTGTEPQITEEEEDMQKLIIEVGDITFTATLYDNETVAALTEMLPLTLNMSELNGNEKYYYLDGALPTDSKRPSGIKAGDIMLYGNSCLVLFYESFSTSYSYTPIGRIDDPNGLASALGKKSAEVTFRLK